MEYALIKQLDRRKLRFKTMFNLDHYNSELSIYSWNSLLELETVFSQNVYMFILKDEFLNTLYNVLQS